MSELDYLVRLLYIVIQWVIKEFYREPHPFYINLPNKVMASPPLVLQMTRLYAIEIVLEDNVII